MCALSPRDIDLKRLMKCGLIKPCTSKGIIIRYSYHTGNRQYECKSIAKCFARVVHLLPRYTIVRTHPLPYVHITLSHLGDNVSPWVIEITHPLGQISQPSFSKARGAHTTQMMATRSFRRRIHRWSFASSPFGRDNQLRNSDEGVDCLVIGVFMRYTPYLL